MAKPTMRPASAGDLAAFTELLTRANLPPDGLADQFPEAYVVAEAAGVLVGAAGLETYGSAGLLRSVVVAEGRRGSGLGEALVRDRLASAQRLGLAQVYTLTTSAAPYFLRLGFVTADRATAPETLRSAPQLASVCPASAAFLQYRLSQ